MVNMKVIAIGVMDMPHRFISSMSTNAASHEASLHQLLAGASWFLNSLGDFMAGNNIHFCW